MTTYSSTALRRPTFEGISAGESSKVGSEL